MKIQTVIFDLDGTLLDTTEGVLESVVYAANKMGYSPLSYDVLLKFVGPPIQNSFMEYYGCTELEAQEAANLFRYYYKNEALLKAKPYEGIYELCENLVKSGKTLAVATYKREDYALKLLKYYGFDQYCVSIHGADNNNVLKKADIVNICMQETGSAVENTVLVGDTVHDALGAQNIGISFIGITYGFGFTKKNEIVGNICFKQADSPMDIIRAINEYENEDF